MRKQGRDVFDGYWAGVASVEVISQPRVTGQQTVHIGIRLAMRDGGTVTEFHQFGVTRVAGAPRLSADTLLHSETSPPPPPPPPPPPAEDDGREERQPGNDEDRGADRAEDERKGEEDKKGEKEKNGHKREE